jgi:hypothetical protein
MKCSTVVAVAFLLVASVQDASMAAGSGKLVAKLQAENSSQNGGVRLTQKGSSLVVELRVSSAGTSEPASLYHGSCSKIGALSHTLSAVNGGTSTTTLPGVSLGTIRKGTFAVVIHASASDMQRYVSCGDVGRGAHLMQDTDFNGFGGRVGQ